jgi:hypothetical protein
MIFIDTLKAQRTLTLSVLLELKVGRSNQHIICPLAPVQTANIVGHTKKVVTNACLSLGYCTGNITGSFFYKASQSASGAWSSRIYSS